MWIPQVHFFDIIHDYDAEIDFHALGRIYKEACDKQDLQLLPPPFGLKAVVSKKVSMQMAILKNTSDHYTIVKHFSFPKKVKVQYVCSVNLSMAPLTDQNGCIQIQRLVVRSCNSPSKAWVAGNSNSASFPAKLAKALPKPFRLKTRRMTTLTLALTTSSNLALEAPLKRNNSVGKQNTVSLRNPDSPIYGWPVALVENEKALHRQVLPRMATSDLRGYLGV